MKEIYFVIDPSGKIWKDTVAADQQACQQKFANMFFGSWPVAIGGHLSWEIWQQFERIGFKMESIELISKHKAQ